MENVQNTVNIHPNPELRPCWVDGRRAFFHRWADSARPVTAKGAPDDIDQPRYQLWNVHGIVEFEDGTLDRVWVYRIQFAENPRFKDYDWEYMERERDEFAGTFYRPAMPAVLEIERALEQQYGALGEPAPTQIVAVPVERTDADKLLDKIAGFIHGMYFLPEKIMDAACGWLWRVTFGRN